MSDEFLELAAYENLTMRQARAVHQYIQKVALEGRIRGLDSGWACTHPGDYNIRRSELKAQLDKLNGDKSL